MWLALFLGIQVIFKLPPECGPFSNGEYIGCTHVGGNEVYIKPGMSKMATDHVIFHELYHVKFGADEQKAEEFALTYTGGYELTGFDVYPERFKRIYINLNK